VPAWKVLHILAMFSAVTLMIGGEVLFHALVRTGDVPAMRRYLRVVDPLFRLGIVLLIAGVVFGLITAVTGVWSLTAGWLIASYVLVGAIFAIGFLIGVPWFRRVGAAAEIAADGGNAEPLAEALDDPRGLVSIVSSFILYPAVIYLMVAKPFP
jgi:uncharacterized membrane protein